MVNGVRAPSEPTRSRFSKNAREFLRYCAKYGFCGPELEEAILAEKSGAGRLTWLRWDEVEKLLAAIDEYRLELAIAWLFYTGCRVNEAITADQMEVHWDSAREMYSWSIPDSKTGFPRDVWLPAALNPYIERSRAENKPAANWPVLWDCDGRGYARVEDPNCRISEKTINAELDRACRKAGILKPVTAHVARHSYCSNWITDVGDGEADLKRLSAQVGASVPTLRKTYVHISGTDEQIELIKAFGGRH